MIEITRHMTIERWSIYRAGWTSSGICGALENSKIARGIPEARVKAIVRTLCRDITL
jgi:hypothetical protein